MNSDINLRPRERTLSAVITRADGTVEDLGAIAYWHRNHVRVWAWYLLHPKQLRFQIAKRLKKTIPV